MTITIQLKVKILDITAEVPVCVMNVEDAREIDAGYLSRIEISNPKGKGTCILDTSLTFVDVGVIGLFRNVAQQLKLDDNSKVTVNLLPPTKSVTHIINKIKNKILSKDDIYDIVKDIDDNKVTDLELSSFVTACYINGLNIDESKHLCNALIDAGDSLNYGKKEILDKHSIGGINGRVSLILTPIISSLGYFMPKTASRSIASAAGTADCMEVLAPVGFTLPEIKKILEKTGAVIAWEGKFDLCPVDNTIIKVEHALSINPEGIMIASILSKKKSAGATHLVIDVPVGSKMKVKDKESAERLAKKLVSVSKSLGIKAKAILTDGEEPCGRAFGAALEAREVMRILENRYFDNLANKSCILAGELLELAGRCKEGEGFDLAKETLVNGKALLKMQEIIRAQGGTITSSDQIKDAKYKQEIFSKDEGTIKGWDIESLTKIARCAGAPEDKEAGVLLCRYVGETIKKGDKILEIYSNSKDRLDYATQYYQEDNAIKFDSIILGAIE